MTITREQIAQVDTTPRFSYYGRRLTDTEIAALPDSLICKDNTDGALIVHRRTQRLVPVPQGVIPAQRQAPHER